MDIQCYSRVYVCISRSDKKPFLPSLAHFCNFLAQRILIMRVSHLRHRANSLLERSLMSHILKQFTATLQQLGTPETITALSTQGYAPSTRPRVNSHLHLPPNFSAFETVAQAVALMEAQGIGVVGVSNYYDFTVYGDFAERVNSAKVFPLFGLEVIALLDNLVTGG